MDGMMDLATGFEHKKLLQKSKHRSGLQFTQVSAESSPETKYSVFFTAKYEKLTPCTVNGFSFQC